MGPPLRAALLGPSDSPTGSPLRFLSCASPPPTVPIPAWLLLHPPRGAPARCCRRAPGSRRPGPGGEAWPHSRHRWRPAAAGRAPTSCRAQRRAPGRGWGRPRCSRCAARARGGAGRAPAPTRQRSLHHRRSCRPCPGARARRGPGPWSPRSLPSLRAQRFFAGSATARISRRPERDGEKEGAQGTGTFPPPRVLPRGTHPPRCPS